MSDHPTREEILASIVAKSDQLNADDLIGGPITVAITKVRKGDREQPIVVEIEGRQPYKPCKTMRRVLIAVFGDEPGPWVGERMTLYRDPEVMYAGLKVGGIRISHLSKLTNPRTFVLTERRGKKAEITIHPIQDKLPEPTVEEQAFIETATALIQAADSVAKLRDIGVMLKEEPATVQAAMRPIYAARKKELE